LVFNKEKPIIEAFKNVGVWIVNKARWRNGSRTNSNRLF
jgi:hypothetical protein